MLVPLFGYQAAAYTTFAALMYMGYAGFYMKAYRSSSLVPYYPVAWLALTVVLLFVVYELVTVAIITKVILTALAGAAAIVAAIVYRRKLLLETEPYA
jgi:hypothetical protein